MNTKEWNILDKFISWCRLLKVLRYLNKNDIVLDIGCGVQHYFLNCGKRKFRLGYGLDYDVQDCQKGNIILKQHKHESRLPLESNYFDKVFILAVLEHIEVENVPVLFSELSRILKPGGSVIITTPTPKARGVLEFMAFKLKVVTAEEVTDHKHYYVHEEIRKLAGLNGLNVAKYGLFQFGLNSIYILKK